VSIIGCRGLESRNASGRVWTEHARQIRGRSPNAIRAERSDHSLRAFGPTRFLRSTRGRCAAALVIVVVVFTGRFVVLAIAVPPDPYPNGSPPDNVTYITGTGSAARSIGVFASTAMILGWGDHVDRFRCLDARTWRRINQRIRRFRPLPSHTLAHSSTAVVLNVKVGSRRRLLETTKAYRHPETGRPLRSMPTAAVRLIKVLEEVKSAGGSWPLPRGSIDHLAQRCSTAHRR
jgi:hypothetical protein